MGGAAKVWKGNKDLRRLLVPLDALVEDGANARRHTPQNLTTINQSVAKFGQTKPLVGWRPPAAPERSETDVVGPDVERQIVVMCGNGTLSQIRALGWTHVAVSIFEGSRIDARAMAIVDNLSSDFAEWNEELLARQKEEIAAAWREETSAPVVETVHEAREAPASHALSARIDDPAGTRAPDRAPPPRPSAPAEPEPPKTYARATAEKIASIPDGPQRAGLIDSAIRRVLERAAKAAEDECGRDCGGSATRIRALADEVIA